MPGKANVYTLGEFGVNRVKSPIHLIDGELLVAQNADVPFVTGNRGLRKRSGMAKHNEVAAAGAIHSMINVPIPDPLPDTVDPPPPLPDPDPPGVNAGDIFMYEGVSGWVVSTDGDNFTTSTTPATPLARNVSGNVAMVSHRDRIYQVGNAFTSFDASRVVETHGTLSGTITRPILFCDWSNDLIFGVPMNGLGTFPDTAFRYNVATEAYEELPGTYGLLPFALGAVGGVPLVSSALSSADIVMRHNGSTWVTETFPVTAAFFRVMSFALGPVDGKLYAGLTTSLTSSQPRIVRREGTDSWTTVFSLSAAGGLGLCAAPDALYAFNGATRVVYRSDDDGASWPVDANLSASIPGIDAMMPWNDQLFAFNWQTSGVTTLRRSSGGVWTEVTDLTFAPVGGAVGYV